jgi:glucose-6-phosphate isomerase
VIRLDDYLGIVIDDEYNLIVKGEVMKPRIRKKREMASVLWRANGSDEDMYYMYREVFLKRDRSLFEEHRIRHDVTLIPSKKVNGEFNKTLGHYHTGDYPEVYEVLRGEALFLMQSRDYRRLIIVEARRGDQVLILSGYGHVTVNVGEEPLIMSNLVFWDFESDYRPFLEKRGALVYVTEQGLVRNENYDSDFEVIKRRGRRLFSSNIYEEFVKEPGKFVFLREPEKTPSSLT